MTLVNAYCSSADVRDQLGDRSGLVDIDMLDKAINASCRAIDRYCGRRFWQDAAVSSREYRVEDDRVAWVDDISTSTGLVIKTDTTGDGSYATTWTSTDYVLEPLNASVVAAGDTGTPFAWWRISAVGDYLFIKDQFKPTLQITAKFGWSAIPDEVVSAAILKSVSLYKRKDAPFGVAGFSEFGAVRIGRSDPEVVELLHSFRLLTVGDV